MESQDALSGPMQVVVQKREEDGDVVRLSLEAQGSSVRTGSGSVPPAKW